MSLAMLYDDIWVQSSNCTQCKIAYNPKNSTTSVNLGVQVVQDSMYDAYAMLILSGNKYQDSIELEGLPVIYNVSVANIFVDPLNLAEDGILGLGTNEFSIVYKLYEESLIDEPIYSLQATDIDFSYLILGTPNFSELGLAASEPKTISYKDGIEAVFCYDGIQYPSTKAEFSSISSYILGPYEQLHYFYTSLRNDYDCFFFEEYIVCDCENEYPDIYFIIQGVNLTLSSSGYLMKVIYK